MLRIALCPACHGELLLAADAPPLAELRCPLCEHAAKAHDLLASSRAAPPMALRVETAAPAIVASDRSQATSDPLGRSAVGSVSSRRERPREGSFLGQLVGIVGGGALGLAIGYLGLLRFGGEHYDFLQLAGRLPEWATGIAPEPTEDVAPREVSIEATSLAPIEIDVPPVASEVVEPAASPTDASPAVESTPSAPAVNYGPANVELHSATELEAALAAAFAAFGCVECNSSGLVTRTVVLSPREVNGQLVERTEEKQIPCPACGGNPLGKLTPEDFRTLTALAEVVTFVDPTVRTSSDLRESILHLLTRVAADEDRAATMGRLAKFHLENHARDQNGVALAGTVRSLTQEGELYTTDIVLFGLPKQVTVVSWRQAEPALKPGDRVVILGSVVDDPATNLVGYVGQSPQVVWGGLPALVERPNP